MTVKCIKFITSDEHFGHLRIIEKAKRPFISLEEMARTLIERFNSVVPNNKNIITHHAGDMFWHTMSVGDAVSTLSQLHGSHGFSYGNHDELIAGSPLLRDLFVYVIGENKAGGAKIIHHNKHSLTIDHFARRVWQGSHKGHWHVFGHSHAALRGLGKSFDIGVDGHNLYPWSVDEIEQKMGTLTQHHSISNTGSDIIDEARPALAGSTFHAAGCACGFCQLGSTKA